MFQFLKKGLVILAILALGACTSQSAQQTDEVQETKPVATVDTSSTAASADADKKEASSSSSAVKNPLHDPDNILSQRLVFFEFDSYTIEPQFRSLIEAHARYLTTHPSATLTLRGHTDERGTHEYNIALGQRRSDAVKRVMTLFGVNDAKIETVSFGKEVPRNPGHDEAAWAENRRVEIVYVTE